MKRFSHFFFLLFVCTSLFLIACDDDDGSPQGDLTYDPEQTKYGTFLELNGFQEYEINIDPPTGQTTKFYDSERSTSVIFFPLVARQRTSIDLNKRL